MSEELKTHEGASPSLDVNDILDSKQRAILDKQSRDVYKHLKKILKVRSKSDLVNLLIEQSSAYQEMQHINKMLLQRNKELESTMNELTSALPTLKGKGL